MKNFFHVFIYWVSTMCQALYWTLEILQRLRIQQNGCPNPAFLTSRKVETNTGNSAPATAKRKSFNNSISQIVHWKRKKHGLQLSVHFPAAPRAPCTHPPTTTTPPPLPPQISRHWSAWRKLGYPWSPGYEVHWEKQFLNFKLLAFSDAHLRGNHKRSETANLDIGHIFQVDNGKTLWLMTPG